MKQLKALILAAATLVMAQAYAESDAQIEKIRERIAPVGEVCVGAECGGVAVVAGEPRTGEEVYNTACTACHGAGVLGAPKKGDKAAWDDRLAKGLEETLHNAINGINAMPPKGNCATCSDDEILNAIKYMAGR
ncbi:Cytochrome c5 [Thalassolituus maritimus]|uniref:Cytochrome c5 n=1 Tax=Thalassolituus maritimus TaxID=484498 RepID=A0A1N7P106_9GAMM|nr:Cytochrome c5 [Thalassolituus maritimus]